MQYFATSAGPARYRTGCIVAAVYDGKKLSPTAEVLDEASKGALTALARSGDLPRDESQTLMLNGLTGVAAERVLLVALGNASKLDAGRMRKAYRAASAALTRSGASSALSCLGECHPDRDDLVKSVR